MWSPKRGQDWRGLQDLQAEKAGEGEAGAIRAQDSTHLKYGGVMEARRGEQTKESLRREKLRSSACLPGAPGMEGPAGAVMASKRRGK